MKRTFEDIARQDGRYDPNALRFVFEMLGHTIRKGRKQQEQTEEPHHISGSELALSLADIAREKWGRLAKMVLNIWGIKTTRDIGEIVYLMIRQNWMTAQETDRIEDFDNVYDFEEIFEKRFVFEIK